MNRVGRNIADLIINRVRVLGSEPHSPVQFFWEYPRPQTAGRVAVISSKLQVHPMAMISLFSLPESVVKRDNMLIVMISLRTGFTSLMSSKVNFIFASLLFSMLS